MANGGWRESDQEFGDAGVFRSDLRIVLMLLNEARYRSLHRVFGTSRDQANLLMAVVALMLAGGAYERAQNARVAPSPPSLTSTLFGTAVVNGLVHGIAADASDEAPFVGLLIAFAFLARVAGPPIRESAREVRASSHRVIVAFHHRYGHLLGRRPGQHALR